MAEHPLEAAARSRELSDFLALALPPRRAGIAARIVETGAAFSTGWS